ncbi:MAG: hypothetical protein LBH00_07595 [Planctomycetaceae bacterium]|nr:hypothetical protein [Planctomycetaceae bacterium]
MRLSSWIILISVFAAGMCCAFTVRNCILEPWKNSAGKKAEDRTVKILIAKRTIPVGKEITGTDVFYQEIPRSEIPPYSIPLFSQVYRRSPAYPIPAGCAICDDMLTPAAASEETAFIPAGNRLVDIDITPVYEKNGGKPALPPITADLRVDVWSIPRIQERAGKLNKRRNELFVNNGLREKGKQLLLENVPVFSIRGSRRNPDLASAGSIRLMLKKEEFAKLAAEARHRDIRISPRPNTDLLIAENPAVEIPAAETPAVAPAPAEPLVAEQPIPPAPVPAPLPDEVQIPAETEIAAVNTQTVETPVAESAESVADANPKQPETAVQNHTPVPVPESPEIVPDTRLAEKTTEIKPGMAPENEPEPFPQIPRGEKSQIIAFTPFPPVELEKVIHPQPSPKKPVQEEQPQENPLQKTPTPIAGTPGLSFDSLLNQPLYGPEKESSTSGRKNPPADPVRNELQPPSGRAIFIPPKTDPPTADTLKTEVVKQEKRGFAALPEKPVKKTGETEEALFQPGKATTKKPEVSDPFKSSLTFPPSGYSPFDRQTRTESSVPASGSILESDFPPPPRLLRSATGESDMR